MFERGTVPEQGLVAKVNPMVFGVPANEPLSPLAGSVNVDDAPVTQFSPVLENKVGEGLCGTPSYTTLKAEITIDPVVGVAWPHRLASVAVTVQWAMSVILKTCVAFEPGDVAHEPRPTFAFREMCSFEAVPVELSAGENLTKPADCVQVTLPYAV